MSLLDKLEALDAELRAFAPGYLYYDAGFVK
jgi:hypothetical protein